MPNVQIRESENFNSTDYQTSNIYYDEDLKELKALASGNGTKIIYLSQGEKIQDGELRFSCVYPASQEVDYSDFKKEDRNNSSLVLLMQYQEFEMLFTGDVEMAGEHEIVNYVQELTDQSLFQDDRIDVLKVAHHGSSGSSCEEFLEAIQPKISLISCGKNNSYGHPHQETLDR